MTVEEQDVTFARSAEASSRPSGDAYTKAIALFGFCVVGWLVNHANLTLFFGVEFLPGSAISIIALAILGPWPAMLVAAVSSSYTILLWGHPYAALIFIAEIAFICLLRDRVRLVVLSDALFWLAVGVPAVFGLYIGFLDLDVTTTATIALKQMVNGIMNASFASICLLAFEFFRKEREQISLTEALFDALVAAILIPGVLLIAIETHQAKIDLEKALRGKLETVANVVQRELVNLANDGQVLAPGLSAMMSTLSEKISQNTAASFALLDKDEKVLLQAGNANTITTGVLKGIAPGFQVWLPPRGNDSVLAWWERASYVHTAIIPASGEVTAIRVTHEARPVVDSLRQRNLRAFLILILLAGFSVIASAVISIAFTRPLNKLGSATRSLPALIQNGHPTTIPDSRLSEIQSLSSSIGTMAQSLSSTFGTIAEKNQRLESLSSQLARYLSPQVYEAIFSGRQAAEIHTTRKKLTVCFTDLKGFTLASSELQPEELTFVLNTYFEEMAQIAQDYGANIDKFIGDAMVIFFGDPDSFGVRQDALKCVHMAMAMQRRLAELDNRLRHVGLSEPLQMRIGINTGYCNVGNFGSADRMDYTIIGSEVNVASRLERLCPPGSILISNETYVLVSDAIAAEEIQLPDIKGVTRAVRAFSVNVTNASTGDSLFEHNGNGVSLQVDLAKVGDKDAREAQRVLQRALDEIKKRTQ